MTATLSATAVATAIATKVNGSATAILTAAVNADKARGKLAEQVRALFASPVAIVQATLSEVFKGLEAAVTRKGSPDAEAWARIANSIATNVRIQWNASPEESRPAVCYIALDRGALTANVVILDKPSKAEVKAALSKDPKACNAAVERLFGKKPAPASKPADGKSDAPKVGGSNDTNAPTGGTIGAIMEMARGLSRADLETLAQRIAADIKARDEAALAAKEKAGQGPSATGKPNAKSRGESQRKAKEKAAAVA